MLSHYPAARRRPAVNFYRRFRRLVHVIVSVAVVAAGLSFLAVTPAAAAGASITLTKSAPDSVLVGDDITYTLKAENTAAVGDKQYNLTFRDILPAGVKYVKTTAPSGLGDPVQTAEKDVLGDPTGRTILIWLNVADLPGHSDVTVSYTVKPSYEADPDDEDAPFYVVGDDVGDSTTTATAYVSSAERTIPKFIAGSWDPNGDITASDEASVVPTKVSALEIVKSEPSPEHELVRGIDARSTTYTLKVTNNSKADTTGVTVVDYLPAGLEFLGCKDLSSTECPAPDSVETVSLGADAQSGRPAGVYTKVTWTVGTLGSDDANRTSTITYAAGIPLQENVMPADPGSFDSTNNLANNTGTPTRETDNARHYWNYVDASGTYTGPVKAGTSDQVTARDSYEVTAQDIALHKTVDNADFSQGEDAIYTLEVRVSEYTDGSDIVMVDTLPDGMCPSDAASGTYTDDAATEANSNPQCKPLASAANAAIHEVDFVENRFVITFNPIDVSAAEKRQDVTYKAKMRTNYLADADGLTSAGDTYGNTVKLTGTTDPVAANSVDSGTQDVVDNSATTIASGSPTIDKRILPNELGTDYKCDQSDWDQWSDDLSELGDLAADPPKIPDYPFMVGSRVCFWIKVQFPENSSTRDPVITDYLPANLKYEAGSFQLVDDPGNQPGHLPVETAIKADFANNSGDGIAALTPWDQTVGTHKYVDKGKVLSFKFSATVIDPPGLSTDLSQIDVQGNLAKMQWTDRDSRVTSARDQTDFLMSFPPPIGIKKLVAPATSPADLHSTLDIDDQTKVHYQIAVTNDSVALSNTNNIIYAPDIWDVLPPGFDCDTVSGISAGGVCADPSLPADPAYPNFNGNDKRSIIRWQLPATVILAAQALEPLTVSYDMTPPNDLSVDGDHINTAYVHTFDTKNNIGEYIPHYPSNNVDQGLALNLQDVSPASSTATVKMPKVKLTKSSTSAVADNNRGAAVKVGDVIVSNDQAVPGETVKYTIQARIPAHSTVYNGVLTDPTFADPTFPLEFQSATFAWSDENTAPQPGSWPGDFTESTDEHVSLTFPAEYSNNSNVSHIFEITVTAIVKPGYTSVASQTNTAHFNSQLSDTDPTPTTEVTASTTVDIVQPAPAIAKVSSTDKPVPGTSYTYTLTATNPGTVPSLYDSIVTDCVPAGISVSNFVATQGGATSAVIPTPAPMGSDCPAHASRITWTVGTIEAGSTKTLTYDAVLSSVPAGLQSYANIARLTGSTLVDGVNDPATERVIGPIEAKKTVTVPGATLTKAIADSTLTIGEYADYTVKATIPKDINFYDLALIDVLPATNRLDLSTLETTSVTCAPSCTVTPPAGTGDGTTLTRSGSTIGWSLGNLAASTQDRTVTIEYRAKVADIVANTASGTLRNNSAQLKWNVTDKTDPTTVGATFDQQPDPVAAGFKIEEPNLVITKSVDDTTPDPKQNFTYTVTVTNSDATNTSPAHSVVVTDAVPTGVIVDKSSLTANGGVLTGDNVVTGGGTITWTLTDQIAKGASKVLTYQAKLAPSEGLDGTALANNVKVSSYRSLENDGRTYSTLPKSATVTPQFPKLTIAKKITAGAKAIIGEPSTFEVTITNTGTAKAFDIDVSDVLPAHWAYVAGSAHVVIGAADTQTNPTPSGQKLTWSDLVPSASSGVGLAASQTVVITYDATPSEAAVGAGSSVEHKNVVTIDEAKDASGATGHATAIAYGGATANAIARMDRVDLGIDKSHAVADTAVAGEDFNWKIVVTNYGPDAETGPLTVTDTLPTGFTVPASFTGTNGWVCGDVTTDRVMTCTLALATPLATGKSAPDLVITGAFDSTLTSGLAKTNTASVVGTTYENPADVPLGVGVAHPNTDSDSVTLTTLADLSIEKKLIPASVTAKPVAGQNATYRLAVKNLGPSTSRGTITVTDDLPDYLTPISATGVADGWDCDLGEVDGEKVAGAKVVCTLDGVDLIKGQSSFITLKVAIDKSQRGTVVNTASVAGTTPEPDTETAERNNDDTETTPLTTKYDLGIQKSLKGAMVAGANATYTMHVTNSGPSTAKNVTITDTLPTYLKFVSSSDTDGWTCTADEQIVTCDLDEQGVGSANDTEVDITVHLAAGHVGDVANTASIASTQSGESGPLLNTSTVEGTDASLKTDLGITKSHPATPAIVAGGQITYELTVVNNGPTDAPAGITVTDVIPDGMTYTSVSGAASACTVTTVDDVSTATCVLDGPLKADDTDDANVTSVFLTFDIDSDIREVSLDNEAAVTPPTNYVDEVTTNNTDTDEADITDVADVRIAKSAVVTDKDKVPAGSLVDWTLEVTNHGLSDADDVVVTDTLPTGVAFADVDPQWEGDGWDCTVAGSTITCERATVKAGVPAPAITIHTKVASGAGVATIKNSTSVITGTDESDETNNGGSDTIKTIELADIELTKSHDVDVTPVAGESFDFAIAVKNLGPSDATGPVVVTDSLPVGMRYQSVSAGWSCVTDAAVVTSPQKVTCTLVPASALAKLVAGKSAAPLVMTVMLAPDTEDVVLKNQATVKTETPQPADSTDNDSDDDTITPTGEVNLSITKSHDAATVRVGDELTFTLNVHNDGPSEARNVKVEDVLPTGLTLVDTDPLEGDGWSCADGECTLDDPLAPDADAEPITVRVIVGADAYPGVENTATVTSDTTETDDSDNEVTDPVTVPPKVDLSIVKELQGGLKVGRTGTYTLKVANAGPTADPGVITVTDVLPVGLGFVSGTAAGWNCSAVLSVVTCTRTGAFAKDASETITLTVNVDASAYPSVKNTALVFSDAEDTDPDNNTSTVPSSPVLPTVILKVDKTHTGTPVAGKSFDYTVKVHNDGPSAAQPPITITDTLPAGMTYRSVNSTWTCSPDKDNSQKIDCTLKSADAVPAGGDVADLVMTVDIAADQAGKTLDNTVVAGSLVIDPSDPVGTDTDTVTPVGVADLSIKKSHTGKATVGQNLVFTLTAHNAGPSQARGVTVTDTLPAGLKFVKAAGAGWTCLAKAPTCTLNAPLAPGKTAAPVKVTVKVTAAARPSVTNIGRVSMDKSTTTDPVPGNNSAKDKVTVPAAPGAVGGESGTGLPGTGGAPAWMLGAGVLALLAGGVLLAGRRKRGRHCA